ncbi:MAG: arginine--tRNA ligase [Candidatus Kerfeldbacteria bacterium]|nr:arginine--tRNA ligase [Candidatus Kerfeldbacteria bacterium]
MTIQQRILKDITHAIEHARKLKRWTVNGTIPEADIVTLSGGHGADFSSTIALQCGPVLGMSPLHIAEDIKHCLQEEYVQVQIAQPGFLYFTLSDAQWLSAIADIEHMGERYGVERKKREQILIECISAPLTQPLMLAQARNVYVADVLARVFERLGYRVIRECVLHDRGAQVEVLGESVMRKYLHAQGMNVPYSDDLFQGEYVGELARTMDLSMVKRTPLNKMEQAKAYVKTEALKTLNDQLHELCTDGMHLSCDSWILESELLNAERTEKIYKKLKSRDVVYEVQGTQWVRTSSYGDDKDREYDANSTDAVSAYVELHLLHDRGVERKVHRTISFLNDERHGYEKRLKALAQLFGTKMVHDTVRTQMVTFVQHGYDMRVIGRNGDGITLKEYIDEVGKDAARFFFVHYSYDEPVRIDMDLMKENSERNPLHALRAGYDRLTQLLAQAEKAEQAVAQTPITQSEKVLMHVVSRFSSVLEQCARTLTVHHLTQYGIDLLHVVNELLKECAEHQPMHARHTQLFRVTCTTFECLFEVLGLQKK